MATPSSSPSSVNRYFVKPFLPGFYSHLRIPDRFYAALVEERKKGYAELRTDASDKVWKVEMEGKKLTKGWKEFSLAHDLGVNDLLVFKHQGNLVFHVLMFGPSCCEITFSNENNMEDRGKRKVKTEVGNSLSENENNLEERGKRKRVKSEAGNCSSDKSEFVLPVTVSNLKSDSVNLPRHFTGSSDLSKQCKEINVMNEQKKSWKVKIAYCKSSGRFRLKNGWRLLCYEKDYKIGDFMKLTLMRNNNMNFLQISPSENHEVESLEAKVENIEDNSSSRFFMVYVTSHSLRDDRVVLPIGFSKSEIVKRGLSEIDLMNKQGKTWRIKLDYVESIERFQISKGWRRFCEENGKRDGSNMQLELVRNMTTLLLFMC